MFNIRDFLKRAGGRQTKELFFRKIVQEAVKKYVNMEIPIESISIKSSTIYLKNLSSGVRSAIFIKKQSILEELNKNQDIYKITDVR